jgi:hypothetical protein
MADVPEGIVLQRHRDLGSRTFYRPARWALLGVLAAFILLGLFNVFGQRPETKWLDTRKAKVELYAPSHLRSGLLYEARITILAHQDIKNAVLQFSPGWNEGMQQNTIEPSPVSEGSRNGDLLFTLGHIPAGQTYRFFMEFQVNATNVGRRRADVGVYDGPTKLGAIRRTVTVFP